MIIDYHIHTNYSDDCEYPMEEVVKDAISIGAKEICFTDHTDYGVKTDWDSGEEVVYKAGMARLNVDYPKYVSEIQYLQEKYADQIRLKLGMEFGVQMHTLDKYEKLFLKYPFDFIILSLHQVEDLEIWCKEFQEGRSWQEYNERYYREMLALVQNYKNYSVLGHIDFIARYDDNGIYPFEKVKPIIEEILKTVIADGKGIEVNTSCFRYGLNDLTPSREILRLYRDLGGRIITIGSDSHKKEHLCIYIEETMQELKKMGFTEYCTYEKMEPVFREIPKCNLTLIMLGTGHATVTKCYNTCFLLHDGGEYFMVDAGGGNRILGILEEQRIELNKIHDLFVTHAHSDHILGAIWMIRKIGQLMRQKEYEGELRIYGHEQVIEGLQTICGIVLMKKVTKLFGDRIKFIALQDGNTHRILNRDITFYDIKAEKLLQYGFRIEETGFVFCGDEPLREELYESARGAKWMIHEAFCLEAECEKFKPHEKKHSTVKDACVLAEKLGVQNLVLVHTEDNHVRIEENSNNTKEDCNRGRKALYIEEGKQFFSGNLIVPDDGERIRI